MGKNTKKRIVPLLKYKVRDFNDYELLCNSNDTKKIVFTNLIDAIEDSIKNKRSYATIFMIDFDNYVTLNKRSWKKSLKAAISFFSSEDIENYEICQKCMDLMNKIEDKKLETVLYE